MLFSDKLRSMSLRSLLFAALIGACAISPFQAEARGGDALRLTGGIGVGSVEDSGYGATGIFGLGWEFHETFGLELQGGAGITEEPGVETEQFFHLELLLPATLTICSSESWVCPGSTFELVAVAGVGGARFEGRWSSNVVAGVAFDSFKDFTTYEVGVRIGVFGSYDVLNLKEMLVMMHLHLGVLVRFGGR
jgi:hypothetical protein